MLRVLLIFFSILDGVSSPEVYHLWPLGDKTCGFDVEINMDAIFPRFDQCGEYGESGDKPDKAEYKPLLFDGAANPFVDLNVSTSSIGEKFVFDLYLKPSILSGVILDYQGRQCEGCIDRLTVELSSEGNLKVMIGDDNQCSEMSIATEQNDRITTNWRHLYVKVEGSNSLHYHAEKGSVKIHAPKPIVLGLPGTLRLGAGMSGGNHFHGLITCVALAEDKDHNRIEHCNDHSGTATSGDQTSKIYHLWPLGSKTCGFDVEKNVDAIFPRFHQCGEYGEEYDKVGYRPMKFGGSANSFVDLSVTNPNVQNNLVFDLYFKPSSLSGVIMDYRGINSERLTVLLMSDRNLRVTMGDSGGEQWPKLPPMAKVTPFYGTTKWHHLAVKKGDGELDVEYEDGKVEIETPKPIGLPGTLRLGASMSGNSHFHGLITCTTLAAEAEGDYMIEACRDRAGIRSSKRAKPTHLLRLYDNAAGYDFITKTSMSSSDGGSTLCSPSNPCIDLPLSSGSTNTFGLSICPSRQLHVRSNTSAFHLDVDVENALSSLVSANSTITCKLEFSNGECKVIVLSQGEFSTSVSESSAGQPQRCPESPESAASQNIIVANTSGTDWPDFDKGGCLVVFEETFPSFSTAMEAIRSNCQLLSGLHSTGNSGQCHNVIQPSYILDEEVPSTDAFSKGSEQATPSLPSTEAFSSTGFSSVETSSESTKVSMATSTLSHAVTSAVSSSPSLRPSISTPPSTSILSSSEIFVPTPQETLAEESSELLSVSDQSPVQSTLVSSSVEASSLSSELSLQTSSQVLLATDDESGERSSSEEASSENYSFIMPSSMPPYVVASAMASDSSLQPSASTPSTTYVLSSSEISAPTSQETLPKEEESSTSFLSSGSQLLAMSALVPSTVEVPSLLSESSVETSFKDIHITHGSSGDSSSPPSSQRDITAVTAMSTLVPSTDKLSSTSFESSLETSLQDIHVTPGSSGDSSSPPSSQRDVTAVTSGLQASEPSSMTSDSDVSEVTKTTALVEASTTPPPPTSTPAAASSKPRRCSCQCKKESAQADVSGMVKQLTLNQTKLSATRRKLTSAHDFRYSAIAAGSAGMAILGLAGLLMLSCDVLSFFMHRR